MHIPKSEVDIHQQRTQYEDKQDQTLGIGLKGLLELIRQIAIPLFNLCAYLPYGLSLAYPRLSGNTFIQHLVEHPKRIVVFNITNNPFYLFFGQP